MADTRPTPLTFAQATRLCVVLLANPKKFDEIQEADQAARGSYNETASDKSSSELVRSAFFTSLALVLLSGAAGSVVAIGMNGLSFCATTMNAPTLQVISAGLLLWGTLFVRGWEIQTSSGVQLVERVNQWLYRSLYCIGTAVFVYSLVFTPCQQ